MNAPLFDTGHFQAQLRGADRGLIAAGAAADDDYIILRDMSSFSSVVVIDSPP
jgi:hypothetical protein